MGGYQIVNLKHIEIGDEPVKIDGVFESIINSNGKPLYVTGINFYGDVKTNAFFVTDIISLSDTECEFAVAGTTISVDKNDMVKGA